jgi:hypothetical protein
VNDKITGRMLLSHNFDLKEGTLPELTKEEFAQVFIEGLQNQANITCSLIDNPHWIVEILFSTTEFSPDKIGKLCAEILQQKRLAAKPDHIEMPDILILGGKKTTPTVGASPTSLQPGEWGVDVVETASGTNFLTALDWDNRIKEKPIDSIFKIEILS